MNSWVETAEAIKPIMVRPLFSSSGMIRTRGKSSNGRKFLVTSGGMWTAQWHDEAWDEPAEVEPPSEEMEQAFKEALEAEKNAEALAMEARRTWAQAQQATAALRKDRGFGAQGVGKGDIRCWTCGGPHMSKDCPDRHHPRYQKGKGKHLSQAELDAYLFKGKGKSEPGDKSAHFQYGEEPWMSYDMNAFFKGKGLQGQGAQGRHGQREVSALGECVWHGSVVLFGVVPSESWFDESMLVPLLVGMDHLKRTGLVLDFLDGHAVTGAEPGAKPYTMPKNHKGHFMVNIVAYMSTSATRESRHSEQAWFELGVLEASVSQATAPFQGPLLESRSGMSGASSFDYMWKRRQSLIQQSLGSGAVSSASHGTQVGVSHSRGHGEGDLARLEGSQDGFKAISMLPEPQSGQDRSECLRELDSLPEMRATPFLHSQGRLSGKASGPGESQDRAEGPSHDPDGSPIAGGVHGKFGAAHHVDAGEGREAQELAESGDRDRERAAGDDGQVSASGDRATGSIKQPREGGDGHHVTPDGIRVPASTPDRGRAWSSQLGGGRADPRASDPNLSHELDAAEDSGLMNGAEVECTTIGDQIEASTKKVCFSVSGVHAGPLSETLTEGQSLWLAEQQLHEFNQQRKPKTGSKKPSGTSILQGAMRAGAKAQGFTTAEAGSRKDPKSAITEVAALPLRVAKAFLLLVTMMTSQSHATLQSLLRGPSGVDTWEMFCAPESWLTQACEQEGLRTSRINLHQGQDLYVRETYSRPWEKFRRERPKKIWVSTRCTYWCPWTISTTRQRSRKPCWPSIGVENVACSACLFLFFCRFWTMTTPWTSFGNGRHAAMDGRSRGLCTFMSS